MGWQLRSFALFFVTIVFLTSCGKGDDNSDNAWVPTESSSQEQFSKPSIKQIPPKRRYSDDNVYFHNASLWAAHVKNSQSWTRSVLAVVRGRMHDLERASDLETFCPGYSSASRAHREICWLRLVGGIVEFESSFQPDEPPFREGNGVYSVGLMALSNGECPNAPTVRTLQDPIKNLVCGVNKLASLIARGGAIQSPKHHGACAYWSTLRPAHRKWDASRRRWLNLGKKELIVARTRVFRSF